MSHGQRPLQHTHKSQWVIVCTPHQPLALLHDQVSGNSKNHSEISSVTDHCPDRRECWRFTTNNIQVEENPFASSCGSRNQWTTHETRQRGCRDNQGVAGQQSTTNACAYSERLRTEHGIRVGRSVVGSAPWGSHTNASAAETAKGCSLG